MTHAQELREIAASVDKSGMPLNCARLMRIADELEALKAREPMTDEQILALLGPFPKYASDWGESDHIKLIRAVEAHHNITSKE